jgi:hypothetical protein
MIVDRDAERFGGATDLLRHLDVVARGLGIATGMIVDPPPLVQIPLSLRCMLYPLPFTTFGEIAALGLEAEVHCSSCYRQTKVADRRLTDRVFAAAPLRCSGMRDHGFAVPLQPCRAPGFLYIKSAVRLPVGGEVTLIFLSCSRCVPPWFIEHMPADRPPWLRAGWGPDDRYHCPHSCHLL